MIKISCIAREDERLIILLEFAYYNYKEPMVLLYEEIVKHIPEYQPDILTFTHLVHAMGSLNWSLTRRLITQAMTSSTITRDMPFYNFVLRSLVYCTDPIPEDIRLATQFVEQMRAEGLVPIKETYRAWMEVYFNHGNKIVLFLMCNNNFYLLLLLLQAGYLRDYFCCPLWS